MIEIFIKKDVIIFLSGVYIIEGIIWKVRNEILLKLMLKGLELDKIFIIIREVNFCYIFYLIFDKLLVNDGICKLLNLNKIGDDEYYLSGYGIGFYIVNNKG